MQGNSSKSVLYKDKGHSNHSVIHDIIRVIARRYFDIDKIARYDKVKCIYTLILSHTS